MKKILTTFLISAFLLLPFKDVNAMRLFSTGFEWQSVTTGVEFTSSGTNTAISTSVKHSGAASINVNPSAAFEWFGHDLGALRSTALYVRIYLYITTKPSAGNKAEVIAMYDATGASRRVRIMLEEGGALQLLDDADAQIGSNSSVLNTGQWYMVELFVDGGASDADARLDGVSFASSVSTAMSTYDAVYFGSPSAASTFDINIDDIAINDTQGGVIGGNQTSWAGAGNIVRLAPTGDGDSNCDSGAGDWANVNELPPSDTSTAGGSNLCELDTTTSTAYFAATDSSTAGIDSYDTISYVYVLGRVREETAGATNYRLNLRSASGGTATTTGVADAGDATTVRTNPISTTAWSIWFGTTTDPTTNVAWTPTGTNSIDNLQFGAGSTDGSPDTWVTTISTFVEYVDGTPPASGGGVVQSEFFFE
jgi:hypothetical protein